MRPCPLGDRLPAWIAAVDLERDGLPLPGGSRAERVRGLLMAAALDLEGQASGAIPGSASRVALQAGRKVAEASRACRGARAARLRALARELLGAAGRGDKKNACNGSRPVNS